MNPTGTFLMFLAAVAFYSSPASGTPEVKMSRSDSGIEFSWPGAIRGEDGSLVRPFFELERSENLQDWRPIGERMRDGPGPEGVLSYTIAPAAAHNFYRIRVFEPRVSKLVEGGEEVFGYSEAFREELERIGQITTEQFSAAYAPGAEYLPKITWDVTTARYWNEFNANPWTTPMRTRDFRLNVRELEILKNNGFVVSERLGAALGSIDGDSFADLFYDIWHNDLPVFVSTDAILQAWHRTYDAMLEEMEETYLFDSLEQILREMASKLPEIATETSNSALVESVRDVDYYLAVARSLLSGRSPTFSPMLGDDPRVIQTLGDIMELKLKQREMFGECRMVDFSQFKVRGHYEHTARLRQYFQCVMWLGRMDLAVAGGPFERCPGVETYASPRQMGNAVVLWDALQRSGQMEAWTQLDRAIGTFVGWSDSLGFAQLGSLLAARGVLSVRDVPDVAKLEELQREIAAGELGVQHIRSDYFVSPLGSAKVQLPRAFYFLGQRFVPDSWMLSKVVFDDIEWVENGLTNKIPRRVPSALEVAFAVLGNDQVVPELVQRIENASSFLHAERWRDGLPYQHNLSAGRNVIDLQDTAAWESNLYMNWLHVLRHLSPPTTNPSFPEAMRTRAWAMKTLNTQLASWTHLRHDTVLYAKQSYTSVFACYYPDGYVEPRVAFWRALARMAERAAALIDALPYTGSYTQVIRTWPPEGGQIVSQTNTLPLLEIKAKQVAHLRNFANTTVRLAELSEKELAQECFNAEDELFIRNLIQHVGMLPYGSGGLRKYDGWYPKLFYRGVQFDQIGGVNGDIEFQEKYGANAGDRVVTDIHTDLPSPAIGDEGSVLHQGIGPVHLLMIAVDNGPDRAVYAGPVLSHYEFEVVGEPTRMSDSDWEGLFGYGADLPFDRSRIQGLKAPPWTSSYLVPRD